MFRPRHAYKSPITQRYRGKSKGCPVFNDMIDITSTIVEQHDGCLECLARIKNRTDLYHALAKNIKPSNHVIKSLQRLSSSTSDNRLKTCLQFLLIKANEQQAVTQPPDSLLETESTETTTTAGTYGREPKSEKSIRKAEEQINPIKTTEIENPLKRQRLQTSNQRACRRLYGDRGDTRKSNPDDSPPQDQVSSTNQDHDGSIQNADVEDRKTCAVEPSISYDSPLSSPLSTSSTCSIESSSSLASSDSHFSSSSPDTVNDLRGPRLRLTDEKIRKIKDRPIRFSGFFTGRSFASTPTTSSGCSPGQHSSTTQDSDFLGRPGPPLNLNAATNHMFQAPARFVNNLKPCDAQPIMQQKPQQSTTSSAPPQRKMLNCAICGIKDQPNKLSKIYGQSSCLLCTKFFATFLKRPQQLYCALDGDCLMTFDSRCQACWIKICLQKFNIEDEHQKTCWKYSPKLLSCPSVSLITIDTSST